MCSHFNIEDKKKKFDPLYFISSRMVKITETHTKMIYAVYSEGTVMNWIYQNQFIKVHASDFSLDNAPWYGRSFEADNDQIENSQYHTPQEIADILKISKSSTENHLNQLGYVNCLVGWVPNK